MGAGDIPAKTNLDALQSAEEVHCNSKGSRIAKGENEKIKHLRTVDQQKTLQRTAKRRLFDFLFWVS